MAKITEFVKQQGEFLKADMIEANTTAKIIGVAEIVHNDKFDTDRLHVPVKIGDKEYTLDASKTNARIITEALGDDTSKWVDKELLLDTYKTRSSDGKMVEAINVAKVIA